MKVGTTSIRGRSRRPSRQAVELRIEHAQRRDAGEILTVQRAAFLADAQIYGDPFLPSLTQTAAEIADVIDDPAQLVIVAREGGRLVGSVRAELGDGSAYVGRLMTVPDRQGAGIGARLMDAIEAELAGRVLELSTGAQSHANLAFYGRRGYLEVGRHRTAEGMEVVTLQKPVAPPAG